MDGARPRCAAVCRVGPHWARGRAVRVPPWRRTHSAPASTYPNKHYAEDLNLAYIPDRTLLNLDVGIEDPDGAWSVNPWGQNITNEVYASSAFAVSVGGSTSPRQAWAPPMA